MKTITIKTANACHPLAPAVLRQLGGGRDAISAALDAAKHGADSGFPGFTYIADTTAFAIRNRLNIGYSLSLQARDLGEDGPVSLVRGFRCLSGGNAPSEEAVSLAIYGGRIRPGDDNLEDEVGTVLNAIAWWALEEVGRAIEAEAER
jgi:hypothetical protein